MEIKDHSDVSSLELLKQCVNVPEIFRARGGRRRKKTVHHHPKPHRRHPCIHTPSSGLAPMTNPGHLGRCATPRSEDRAQLTHGLQQLDVVARHCWVVPAHPQMSQPMIAPRHVQVINRVTRVGNCTAGFRGSAGGIAAAASTAGAHPPPGWGARRDDTGTWDGGGRRWGSSHGAPFWTKFVPCQTRVLFRLSLHVLVAMSTRTPGSSATAAAATTANCSISTFWSPRGAQKETRKVSFRDSVADLLCPRDVESCPAIGSQSAFATHFLG